jgi:hypothetical protein
MTSTGLTEGDFTLLRVLSGGSMQDILTLIAAGGGGGGSGTVTSANSPLSIANGVLSIDLSTYTTTSAMNTLLSNYSLTSSLLAQMTTNILTLRDGLGVDRNLQGSQTGTLVYNSIALATSNDIVNKLDTLTAGAGITVTGTGSSRTVSSNLVSINLVAPLSGSTSGTSVTIESLWKPSTVTAGSGIFCLANDSAGTLQISATGSGGGQTEAQVKTLIANGVTSNDALGRLSVLSSTGNGTVAFAINDAWANSKQDALNHYSEGTTAGSIFYVNTNEPAGTFFNWGSPAAVNNTGFTTITLGIVQANSVITSGLTSGSYTVEMDLRAGTNNNIVLSFHNSAVWTNYQEFNPTMTSVWQTYTFTVNAFPNGALTMNIGQLGPSSQFTLSLGTFDMRYFRIFTSGGTITASTINAKLITGDITSSGVISAVSYTSTSDSSLKENVSECDIGVIMGVFDAISVKQYNRTDVAGKRLGYIAQDFATALPEEYGNIVHMSYSTGNPLLSLDYSRIGCLLWGVCKNQQAELKALTARVAALEL